MPALESALVSRVASSDFRGCKRYRAVQPATLMPFPFNRRPHLFIVQPKLELEEEDSDDLPEISAKLGFLALSGRTRVERPLGSGATECARQPKKLEPQPKLNAPAAGGGYWR